MRGRTNLMDSFVDAWEVICGYCKTKITDVAYKTWIERIKPLNLDFNTGTAYLLVPNDFHRQTLTRCYIPLLNEAFEAVFDSKFNIQFKILILFFLFLSYFLLYILFYLFFIYNIFFFHSTYK